MKSELYLKNINVSELSIFQIILIKFAL